MSAPQILSYGGGTNSTALLVGLHERGERPDAIYFADTGAERPETYAHLEHMRGWCAAVGFPSIERVAYTNRAGDVVTLEADCLRKGTLPSIAFGRKACSEKWKRRPINAAVRARFGDAAVVRLLGFDADEAHRAARGRDDERDTFRYPLIDWDWGRDECVDAIARAGLPQPGKSSCFFCPSSKAAEILALPADLKARAIALEDAARPNLGSVLGLGRRFSWATLIRYADAQIALPFPTPIACDCYDGDEAAA